MEWEKELKRWKRTFPFYMRLLYFVAGYPPHPLILSDAAWENWKHRFDGPEYDWKKHSGVR